MASRSKRTAGIVLAAVLSTLGAMGTQRSLAQIGPVNAPVNGPVNGPDDASTTDNSSGVFVRESPQAMDAFHNGQRMEEMHEWDKAADFYQEVIEKYHDCVIPSQTDETHHPTQYISVIELVQQQLCKWPDAGRSAYLARYEAVAQAMLATATPDDPAPLHAVFDRYFVTDSGKQAGIRLMDGYLESGEYQAAAAVGQRLLREHPGLGTDESVIEYRTALADHFAAQDEQARQLLSQLQAKHPGDTAPIRGKDQVLATVLLGDLSRPVPALASSAHLTADSWPMPFGNPSRSLISSGTGKPGVHLFSVELSKPGFASILKLDPGMRQGLEQNYSQLQAAGGTIGVMPVADGGDLFFQDGQRLYARNLDSNLPLPGWLQTYPGSGDFVLPNGQSASRGNQTSVTLTHHEVLAVMGEPDHQAMLPDTPQDSTRLVCLERESGRVRWIVSPTSFPESVANLRDMELTGSPLVIGQSVLLIGNGGASRGVQFNDTYVVSLDLMTGKYQWSCYVASANVGVIPGFGVSPQLATSHLSYANGLLYAQTNLGALAAIDPFSQSLVWVDLYATRAAEFDRVNFLPFGGIRGFQPQAGSAGPAPWTNNPVIVTQGKIFTLPSRGDELLIYDAVTGSAIKSIPVGDLKQCDTLLGVVGDRVILSGERSVVAVDWKTYDHKTFAAGDLNSFDFDDVIRGRGFVTTTGIFVPVRNRLYWLDPTGNMVVGTYPDPRHTWDQAAPRQSAAPVLGPGNVLVTDTHVIVAGANSVDVYTDLSLATKKLDQQIAENPRDPQPHLRYAVLTFGARQYDQALARLDEAIELMGGGNSIQSGPLRDELFGNALSFATALAGDEQPDVRAKSELFYDRAAMAAQSPIQQVNCLLGRASLAQSQNDFSGAVKSYQSILLADALRGVSMADPQGNSSTTAGALAERAIGDIIKQNPQAYAPFEQAAQDALADARRSSDDPASHLLGVAKTYPNSSIFAEAMLSAADAYESEGNPRQAVRAARELFFHTPDHAPILPRVLETMARNYLLIPGRPDLIGAAAARLAQAAGLDGTAQLQKPLRLPNNQFLNHLTYAQAVEAVHAYARAQSVAALPDLAIPTPRKGQKGLQPFKPIGEGSLIPGIAALIQPLPQQSRFDRIVALTTMGQVEILAPGRSAPLAVTDAPNGGQSDQCAWLGSNLLIWGNTRMNMVREDGGVALWTMDVSSLPQPEILRLADTPVDNAVEVGQQAVIAPRMIFQRNNRIIRGRVIVGPNGRLIIRGAMPIQAPQGAPEKLVQVIPLGDRVLLGTSSGRLICLDLTHGTLLWQQRLSEHPIARLVANDDFAVAMVDEGQVARIVALDGGSGELRGDKAFPGSLQQGGPVNLALSADGTLVYTLSDQLCLKNLFSPWSDVSTDVSVNVVNADNTPAFRNGDSAASRPDQLLISEGRILAFSQKNQHCFVRVFSLTNGQPVPLTFASPDGNQQVEQSLDAGRLWDTALSVVGPHLYVVGRDIIAGYNLDEPQDCWTKVEENPKFTSDDDNQPDGRQLPMARSAIISKDYMVVFDNYDSGAGATIPSGVFNIRAMRICPEKGTVAQSDGDAAAPARAEKESGRTDFLVRTAPNVAIGQWEGINGGLCYLTADHVLHVLLGSKQ